uniref:C2H2-type domain-containing protein n=1 Tax=Strigamia maritima TaxID=126957 RepID=T1JBE9_STRMM
MASVTVNGSLGLDFTSSEEKSHEDSPISGGGYDDSTLNESPYQELLEDDALHMQDDKGKEIVMMEPLRPPVSASKKRRKQSNPVRFASVRLLESKNDDEVDDSPLDLAADLPDGRPDEQLDQLYRCIHCNALFEADEDLRMHIEEEHVQKVLERQLLHHNLSKAQAKDPVSLVGTEKDDPPDITLPYHNMHADNNNCKPCHIPLTMPQLTPNLPMSEAKDAIAGMMPSLTNPFGPPPFLIPLLTQGPSSSQQANIGSLPAPPIRIFNPEAYCEICNKEFCNKYFLKTHKANKHGIYSMDTLTSSPYASAFLTSSVSPAVTIPMRSLLPTTSSAGSSSSTISICDNGSIAKSSGPLNVEAYCEICQKEFCNKYFLRKHKHKIHGMFDPSLPPITSCSTLGGVNGIMTSPASTLDSPVSSSSASSITNVTSSNHMDCLTSELLSKDCNHRNLSQSHKVTMHCAPGILANQTEEEKGFVSQRPYIKPIMGIFTPERLREIGVINADAFCEICCKEFCNKFFLRTHKFSKHGISVPEPSPGTTPAFDDNSKSSTPKNGCSEGTMMGEEMSADLCCDICGRPFASVYLLKMHKFYSHNMPPIDYDEKLVSCHHPPIMAVKEEATGQECPENLVKNEIIDQNSGEDLRKLQTMIQELNAPLLKERLVSCNLCHKEMENKYFLRAHMMNEHGILHNEESNSGESSASVKISMSKDQTSHRKLSFPAPLPQPSLETETFCEICKKDFGTKYFLHVHKTNMHGMPIDLSMPPTSIDSGSTVQPLRPTSDPVATPSSSGDRPSVITGRNYCEICNKELCNKYFMKTHMLKMHGINIEDRAGIKGAAIIGGVTCDICQKELCSKYFLKVHKQNTHGIFEESPSGKENSMVGFSNEKDLGVMPGEITDDNSKYFSHYTEICPICDRRFKSIKWLKTHMVNDHNDYAKENGVMSLVNQQGPDIGKNCLICGKHFSDAVNLQVHTITSHYSTNSNEPFGDLNLSKIPIPVSTPHSVISSQEVAPDVHPEGAGSSGNPQQREEEMDACNQSRKSGNGSRIYHCSYCPYATRWLSNLYAHEKRHTGQGNENDKKFACRLCPRAYRYNHSLQRHMASHRRAAAASSVAVSSNLTTDTAIPLTKSDAQQTELRLKQRVKKYRCSKCLMKFRSRKFCLAHIYDVHSPRSRAPLMTAFYQKGLRLFKCRKCGFTSRLINNLKQHIKQQHKDLLNDAKFRQKQSQGSDTNNVWPTTTTASSQVDNPSPTNQIPMTYAMPQNPPTVGSFIMQPFLMAQPSDELVNPEMCANTFVPSLVYLPVCQKVSQPVTIAFTLTPA